MAASAHVSKRELGSSPTRSAENGCFSIDSDSDEIRAFLDQQGYVVITDILLPDECKQTALALEEEIRSKAKKFCMDDPATHDAASKCLNGYGVIGKRPLFHPCLVRNRCKERIVRAASIAYELKPSELLCSHDRAGYFRPTADHPEYGTAYHAPGLHLDHGPSAFLYDHKSVDEELAGIQYESLGDLVKENNLRHSGMCKRGPYQSIVNLFDNRSGKVASGKSVRSGGSPGAAASGAATGGGGESSSQEAEADSATAEKTPLMALGEDEDDGGHINVPGFHLHYEEWHKARFEESEETSEMFRYIFNPKQKADRKFAPMGVRVPCPTGSMILWNVRTAHGGVPNRNSTQARAIQFLSYFPRSILSTKALQRRKQLLRRSIPKEAVPKDKTSRAVLGID